MKGTVDDYIDDQNNSNKQFVIITNVAFTFFIYDVEKFIHKQTTFNFIDLILTYNILRKE